jgi:hypothetical protein
MRVPQHTNLTSPSSRAGIVGRLGPFWSGRRGLLILGGVALSLGVGLNWGWLAAAGITRILIAFLPCAAMCALGLCLPRLMRAASDPQATGSDTSSNATLAVRTKHLELEAAGAPPAQLSGAPLPAIESVEQSCCHAPTEKENDYAKSNS